MQILLNDRKVIIAIGTSIEYGVWGNIEDIQSWNINNNYYLMDANYTVQFVDEIPSYVEEGKYLYIDGEFLLKDECPNEYRDSIKANTESIITIEDALCETEIANEDRLAALEDAICELSIILTNN